MGDVTVVVATRNRADRLAAVLDRLTALPERPPVVVVDNGSRDHTARVAVRAGARLLRLRRNHGATARNLGVEAAGTPYVAFADDDSWWGPGSLLRAAALLDAYPRLGLLAARTLVGPDERLDPMSAAMAYAPLGRAPDLPGPSVVGFLACASVVRRSAFLRCGGFDPVVFFMGEEARLAYDLAAAGWGLAYCPAVVAYHHPGDAGGSARKGYLASRNALLTATMRRPMPVVASAAAAFWRRYASVGAAADLARRIPAALLRRRTPDALFEAMLRRVQTADLGV